MSNRSLAIHGCTVAALTLVLLTFLTEVYGDDPDCNYLMASPAALCGTASPCKAPAPGATSCPSYTVAQQSIPPPCGPGSNSTYCTNNPNAICTKTFTCTFFAPAPGSPPGTPGICAPSQNPALGGDGKPIVSKNSSGVGQSCKQVGG